MTAAKQLQPAPTPRTESTDYPQAVRDLKSKLTKFGLDDELQFLSRLNAHVDAKRMWCALERQSRNCADPAPLWDWAHEFLMTTMKLYAVPAYTIMPGEERRNRADKIHKLAKELARELRVTETDRTIHGLCLKLMSGEYFPTDFGQVDRAQWIELDSDFASVAMMIEAVAALAEVDLKNHDLKGKASKNAKEIRFIRGLVNYNRARYGKPVQDAVSIACAAIFGVTYTKAEISELTK